MTPADATTGTPEGTESRASGRPRDPRLDEAIILATRARLVQDGYSRMTLGDIAADAGVSRPTLYRRWANKLDLVADAMDYGFRGSATSTTSTSAAWSHGRHSSRPYVAWTPRIQPGSDGADGQLRRRGEPHPRTIRDAARARSRTTRHARRKRAVQLQERGAVSDDIDRHTIATMCFGSYFAAFYRGDHKETIPESVVAVVWPAIAS